MLFQVLGLWFIHLNEIFLGLGLTVTEINIKRVQKQEIKNIKDVGMACQKVYKQGRDDSIKAKGQHKGNPYIFFTLQLDSMLET